jgi:uncharacterized protein
MRLLVAMILLVGCNQTEDNKPKPKPQTVTVPATSDPWNTAQKAGDVPTLGERVALANKACPKVTGPFFFELTKAGKTSHILGTRHIGVGLAKFPDVVGTTLDAASLAVFELAPDDTSGAAAKDELLKKELGEKDWSHFSDLVGKDTAARLEVAPADGAALAMMALYEDLSNTLESQLQERAGNAHLKMIGLETSAFQDRVLANLLDLRMLKASIEQTKDRAEIEKDSVDDLAQYCAGTDDSPGMDDETRTKMLAAGYTKAELDEQDETLVYRRNADWIPKLSKLFEQDKVFVAVGADHLIGPRGVIELMKKQGFTVTRISH